MTASARASRASAAFTTATIRPSAGPSPASKQARSCRAPRKTSRPHGCSSTLYLLPALLEEEGVSAAG
eukprot:10001222-Alexandrium_andersonii.AAC.1